MGGRPNVLGPTQKILVTLPQDMHERLKTHLDRTGRPVNSVIREAIEQWFRRQ